VFIDVGANIGYYSVLGAKIVGNTGKVLSLEPVPETVRVLQVNLKLNHFGNAEVFPFAAYSEERYMLMQVPKN
jgi:FkbM family methyltransferase